YKKHEILWAYWQKQLGGKLPILSLPSDRPRLPAQTTKTEMYRFKLEQILIQQLEELARKERANLFMVFLAGFQILLHRYTNQDDILVSSLTTAENSGDRRRTVRRRDNPVILRANFSGDPQFNTYLQQVRET